MTPSLRNILLLAVALLGAVGCSDSGRERIATDISGERAEVQVWTDSQRKIVAKMQKRLDELDDYAHETMAAKDSQVNDLNNAIKALREPRDLGVGELSGKFIVSNPLEVLVAQLPGATAEITVKWNSAGTGNTFRNVVYRWNKESLSWQFVMESESGVSEPKTLSVEWEIIDRLGKLEDRVSAVEAKGGESDD